MLPFLLILMIYGTVEARKILAAKPIAICVVAGLVLLVLLAALGVSVHERQAPGTAA